MSLLPLGPLGKFEKLAAHHEGHDSSLAGTLVCAHGRMFVRAAHWIGFL